MLPIPRLLPMEDYLDYLANRALPDPSLASRPGGPVECLGRPGHRRHGRAAQAALASLGLPDDLNTRRRRPGDLRSCGIDFPDALADIASKAFMIVIQDFQDAYTLNVRSS